MLNGLSISARALVLQAERHDLLAQNIANAGSAGYRRSRIAFESFDSALEEALEASQSGNLRLRVRLDETPGQLHASGNPCDLALVGPGYFSLQDEGGRVYTRSGAFRLNADGLLEDQQGRPVVGEGGPIRIAGEAWSVGADGSVLVDGAVVDRLLIVDFPPEMAQPQGEGVFQAPAAAVRIVPAPQVKQGQLESSNVQVVEEMVQMITALRAFEASQRLMQAEDQMLDRAVNDVGRT